MAQGTEKYNWASGIVVASGQTIGIEDGGRGKGFRRFGITALNRMVHFMLGLRHEVTLFPEVDAISNDKRLLLVGGTDKERGLTYDQRRSHHTA